MIYSIQGIREDIGVSPVVIGFSNIKKGTHFGPATRDRYIIHYITKGCGYFNGTKLHRGQGFVILPDTPVEYHPDDSEPWTYFWLAAYGNDMEKLLPKVNADPGTQTFNYSFPGKIEAYYPYLIDNNGKMLNTYEILELFFGVFKHHISENTKADVNKNSYIYLNYATEMISQEYSHRITVHDICKKIGISEQYLYKLFIEHYGKSPKKYISDFRISQSKLLLTKTKLSVGEIACTVGFDDQLAFSKFFSSNVGISPSYYREQSKKQ